MYARRSVSGTSRDAQNPPRKDSSVPRLALSPDEAASSLGVSGDFFDEHIRFELRVVRRGRRTLVPVSELERWLKESGSRVLGD